MGRIVRGLLQIAAIVVNFIPGIGQIASLAISAALTVGASLLAPKAKAPNNSAENVNRLRANVDPLTPRKTIIGITAMATDIRDEEFTGDKQDFFHRFIVCASHKVQAIDEIWFDDKLAWSQTGGVQGEYVGYLELDVCTEGSAAEAVNISPRMGSTRRYTGLAYVYLRYKLTGNDKKAESPFAQSIPTRITIRGRGAFLPDPRNPAHNMADQSTWTWNDNACRNPALALLFYLLGWRINGKLAVGKGIPPDRIDLDSFITAANLCDELVPKQGGGTEPRYRCDGVWSEGDSPTTVIDMLKATMNADLDDVGGKLRLTIFHNDLALPVADFTDNDIIDAFTWQPLPPLDATFNVVRGLYTDPSNESLYQQVDYPEQREPSPDGIDRIDTFNLPMVQSPGQAQRLAQLRLQRQKFAGVFEAEFQATAWKVTKNSVIRLTFGQTGFVQKFFRVAEMEIRQDGTVPLKLREEDPAIYGDPPFTQPISPIFSTPFVPLNGAIIQFLGTVEEGANRTQTANANRVPFSRFEAGMATWPITLNASGGATPSFSGLVEGRNIGAYTFNWSAGGHNAAFRSPFFSVQGGERLSVQARAGIENIASVGDWSLGVVFFDQAGAFLSASPIALKGVGGAPDLPGWRNDPFAAFITAPSNARRAYLQFFASVAVAGQPNLILAEPMVTAALPGQTIHPPYTPGPNAFDAADVTGENTAAFLNNQSPWATWAGLTPAVLEAEVATARSDSSIALAALGNIASDAVLDVGEKQQVRQLRDAIVAEFPIWRDRGIEFNVASGLRTAYTNAYNALIDYLASVALDTNVNTAIDRAAFNAAFTSYFTTREQLIDGIAAVAAQRAIWASVTGTGRPEDNADVTAGKIAAGFAGEGPWARFVGRTPAELQGDISTAQADATTALTALSNIANDGVFDIAEKQQVRQLRNDIVLEFPVWRDRAIALNVASGTRTAYQNAYDALIAFLASVAIDSNVNTSMDRATFTTRFNDYFSTRAAIFDGITNAASQVATRLPLGNANRVPFSRFERDMGQWPVISNSSGGAVTPFALDVLGKRVGIWQFNWSAGGHNGAFRSGFFPVQGSERLSVQVRAGIENIASVGDWSLALVFFDQAGTFIEAGIIAQQGVGGAPALPVWTSSPFQAFLTAPSNARFGYLQFFASVAVAGQPNLILSEPMVTSAAAEQTVHPPFTPGPNSFDGADVTVDQPVVGLLNPVTGRANSRRITSQIVASGVLQTLNTNPISASTDGGTGVSTITINAHTVFDDFGQIDFSAASIGGLNQNTLYYVWEANPDFVGGARSYVATTNRNDLTVAGRRYVGFVTTPAVGFGPVDGGGGGGAGFPGLNPELFP